MEKTDKVKERRTKGECKKYKMEWWKEKERRKNDVNINKKKEKVTQIKHKPMVITIKKRHVKGRSKEENGKKMKE